MEITSKQFGSILVALIFFGSTITFALNFALPEEKSSTSHENVYERPISDAERQNFIVNDITSVMFFYSKNQLNSSENTEIENIANMFGKKIIVEKIDVSTFRSFSAEYNIQYVPIILIKGKNNLNAPIRIEGEVDQNELKNDICSTYQNKPDICD